MAHHVQKKAAKHHHHTRPRKSRASDINRKAPEYALIPDTPWMTPIDELTPVNKKTVTLAVAPSDDAAALNAKLQAAGASAVDKFVYSGTELTGTLGDCGLTEESSIEATVRA